MSSLQSKIQFYSILFLLFWIFGLSYSWMTIFRRQEEQSLNNILPPHTRQLNNHHQHEIDEMRPPISHVYGSGVDVESSMKNSPKGKERHRKHEYKVKRAKVTKKKKRQHPEVNLPLPVLAVGKFVMASSTTATSSCNTGTEIFHCVL
jgi:hypothetical protein